MSFKATPVSAFLFGLWTAFIMVTSVGLFEYFEINEDIAQISILVIGVIFFMIPGMFFVFGKKTFQTSTWHSMDLERFKTFPGAALRGLCWLVGVGVFGIPYSELLKAILD